MSSETTEPTASTIVLISPVALDASSWDSSRLPTRPQFRYEYPGHGARSARHDDWDLDWIADDIAATIDGPIDAIGISMGSMVAQHLLVRHPGRVRSAVLAAAGAATNPDVMRERAERILRVGAGGVVTETLERWFTAGAREPTEADFVSKTRATLAAADAPSVSQAWIAMSRHDARDELAGIDAPVTCIAGRDDLATPPAAVTALSEAIPGARLEVLAGPHMLQLETPDKFSAAVRRHFERLEGQQ
ncbi:MAG TPA: alpha/beta fold hydrolase [Galbitalea sp.]